MRPPSALPALPALLAAALLASAPASADVPNGASFLQALGPRAAGVKPATLTSPIKLKGIVPASVTRARWSISGVS